MDVTRIIENINATVSTKCTPGQPYAFAHASTASQLCLPCTRIFTRQQGSAASELQLSADQLKDEMPHATITAIAEAAKQGCHLCMTIYMNLDPGSLRAYQRCVAQRRSDGFNIGMSVGYASIRPIAHDQARLSFRWGLDSKSTSLSTIRPSTNDGLGSLSGSRSQPTPGSESSLPSGRLESELTIELIIMNPIHAVEPGVRTISSSSASTASDECFELAKQWLEDCSFNHMKCSAHEGTGPIPKPTRLLDVSIRGPKGAPGVRLVDGGCLDPFTEYVTLSHCWGISRDPTKKRLRLHNKTMLALRQGIACSSLPRTFADAAAATIKLGYKYLWIDALCIMHDSEQEVLDEVANMHKTYGEATLNLMATAAADDFSGMFSHRNPLSLQPPMIDISDGFGINPGSYKILRSTVWEDLVDLSPIAQRSWIFQERALSKRVLHFSRNELLWECQQMCCSEVYPMGLPVTLKSAAEQDRRINGVGLSPTIKSTVEDCTLRPGPKVVFNKRVHHQRTGNWSSLVEMYTSGRQTYTSDKLLGISGLAMQYLSKNRLRPDDYIVGLWRNSLPHSLLWRVHDGATRPAKYRAPSWTWAAVDGRVVSPTPSAASKQTCLEIINISTKMKNGDPLGLCEGGILKVRGFMARGNIRRDIQYSGHSSFNLCPLNLKARSVRFEHAWFDERLARLGNPGLDNLVQMMEVYLLPVIDVMGRVEGLLLIATETRGVFKRLGMFEISNGNNQTEHEVNPEIQENWDNFKAVMKGDSEMTNFEERLDHANAYWFASDYTYTMNII